MKLPYTFEDYCAAPPAHRPGLLAANEFQFEKELREIRTGITDLKAMLPGTPEHKDRQEVLAFFRGITKLTRAIARGI